ncbi:uncharacterized protein LOC143222630 [Tachypleus tridentatus]|uniref:uncharacterized protein LOC143222630 n=1 Tax=Tachypleus tridentatus TaxID=6853 RepID=UPI003FD0FD2E
MIFCAFLVSLNLVLTSGAEEYEVSDIKCHEGTDSDGKDIITATLRKPDGFRGHPVFTENRGIQPQKHNKCQIIPDLNDLSSSVYFLRVMDFTVCPVKKQKGFLNVQVWFPQITGVVLMNDQDVSIMCQPPEHVITEKQITSFSGNLPSFGRVSGTVKQMSGNLEYIIELYQESTARSGIFDIPVDDAVPIGTLLQLRAAINTNSAWKYAKLLDVVVASSPDDPEVKGHIVLVKNGCRVKDFESIVPKQPSRMDKTPGEVTLDFQAFLLENMESSNQLWLHTKIEACIEASDCVLEFCLDLFQPYGHGRKKRAGSNFTQYVSNFYDLPLGREINVSSAKEKQYVKTTSIGENIGITVHVPGVDKNIGQPQEPSGCMSFLVVSGILAFLVVFLALIAGSLAQKLQNLVKKTQMLSMNNSRTMFSRSLISSLDTQKTVSFTIPDKTENKEFAPSLNSSVLSEL